MKLLGSTTSPYVRRIRVLLENQAYEFLNLDIFDETDRAYLTKHNPTQKIPALIDNDQCVYDSRIIYRYLAEKYQYSALNWQQENILTLIDSVNDALIACLLLSRSGVDTEQDTLFFNLQRERVSLILSRLNDLVKEGFFKHWNYLTICLWCLLDWIEFRDLTPWQHNNHLEGFYSKYKSLPVLSQTDPRQ